MKPKINKNSGFTLIELLVVISIISLLSSIIFAATTSARTNARNAARVQNINSMSKAIELYYADNDLYPRITTYTLYPNSSAAINIIGGGGGGEASWKELGNLLSPYTINLPRPSNNYNYYYFASADRQVCISFGSGRSARLTRGFALLSQVEGTLTAANSDGGISNQYYEYYGGDYQLGDSSVCF